MGNSNGKKALVAGASFAGLSSAYWLCELGYDVTIVEIAPALRTGGTAVNIGGNTFDIAKRMGIYDAIRANRLNLQRWEMKNIEGVTERERVVRAPGAPPPEHEYEIERNVLLNILLAALNGRSKIVFGDSIASLAETASGVDVTFTKKARDSFDLVLGCDGVHSGVRKLWFGEEARFSRYLGAYFSITIVDKLLIERDTAQMVNVPDKVIMLNAYKNSTDIIFLFAVDEELPYDRDESRQRAMINAQFAGMGWRARELLEEIAASTSFYFDKISQIRMPAWSKGRRHWAPVQCADRASIPPPTR